MGEACLTSHSAPATTATATHTAPTAVLTHTATLAGTLRPLTLRQRPLPPPRMAMATHMAATVLATTVVPTVPTVPTVLATVVPTPAMATATHTRVPMLVMLVPMVPAMVVPTLVMAMATHTPATTDVAMATHMATKRQFVVKGFGSVADDCR